MVQCEVGLYTKRCKNKATKVLKRNKNLGMTRSINVCAKHYKKYKVKK